MKRITMILALAVMMSMPAFAERVSPETAQKAAITFLSNNGAKTAQMVDLSKAAGFENLYIFTTESSFVVMSADDCVQPILGYSLTGKFVAENMPTNVSGWLQGYNDEIQYAIDSKMKATSEIANLWKELVEGNAKVGKATAVVNALVQTQWDQNGVYYYSGGQLQIFELYNNLCPYDNTAGERTVTGCVATAMAQIMKYWDYPSQGIGSHSYTPSNRPDLGVQSANFGETTYQWSDMPNKLTMNSTTTQINAIATLMYHCGVSVNMMYDISDNGGSGAYSEDIPNALIHYFNYKPTANIKYKNSYSNTIWMNMLKTELDAGRPIQYSGSGTGGHAFVCDGYDNSNKFHFNWGWSGANDGYYALTNLNPGSGGAGGGGYVFNNNQSAVFGIEPGSSIAAPTNLTYTLSGLNDITLTWNGVSAAASYNVYRNGNLVGNTTSTTYSETVPFGTHDYYVRCVDANSQLSLSSNTVTVTIAYQTPIVTDLTASLSGNNANLTWTAPDWCYPETPSATLTYGNGNYINSLGYQGSNTMHWGHRYLANSLTSLANKILYKISFYSSYSGNYEYYIFKGTITYSNGIIPQTQIAHGSFNVSTTGWFDIELLDLSNIDLNEAIHIDASQDLWVFIYDPESKPYPASYGNSDGNEYGSYYSTGVPTDYLLNSDNEIAWLINTYLTDGIYTYNLYDGTTNVASDISNTNYTVSNIADNTAHQYTLKTNYYDGETEASNMVGFTCGEAQLASLSLAANDKMTITEGSTLTVTGSISNSNAANLVLEDGAQLVSGPVAGTVQKTITGYTNLNNDHEGYYLIASPVDGIQPGNVTNMTNGTYDLYAWDPNEQLEWRNFEAQGSFTTLDAGVGYLYANLATTITLEFAGQLNASFQGVSLDYTANDELHSLTLVGNPYAHQAEFSILNSGSWVNAPNYFTLNANGDGFISNTSLNGKIVLNPMQAVLVQTTAANEGFFEYSDMTPIGDDPELLFDAVRGIVNLKVCNSEGDLVDNAIVRFAEGGIMRKLYLSNNSTRVFIPRGNDEMAIVRSDNERELPVNFKASRNGTYTLSVDNESLGLDYLHLIDNLTGEDVDFLATPSYTFEAKTSDYASRFRLLFAPIGEDADGDNAPFAFISNGNITINQEGTLQIVDMTGRVVMSGDAEHCISTAGMTAGVYVLRLITDGGVKTQKIVIE